MQNPATNSVYSKSKFNNLDFKLIIWFAFATVFAIILRYILFPYLNGDIQNFLIPTIETFKETGRINIINVGLMDVNFAYIYLVSTFSYFADQVILSIKLLNTIFDVLLALGIWAIVKNYTGNKIRAISAYTVSLFVPSMLLVGGMWGQSDTIVATLLIWMLYSALKNRVLMAVVFFAFAISIKWWALFLLPFLAVWIIIKKRKNFYFLALIPAIFILFAVPASLQGNNISDVLSIYNTQTINSPSFNNNIPNFNTLLKSGNTNNSTFNSISELEESETSLFEILDRFSNVFAVVIVSFLLWLAWVFKPDWSWVQSIRFALFSSLLLTFLLPNVHSNYFIISMIISLMYGFIVPRKYWYFIIIEIISIVLIVSDFLSVSLFIDKSFVMASMLCLIVSLGYEIITDFEEFKTLREKVALLSSKYLAKNK